MCLIYLFLHITIQANIMPHYHFKRLTSLEGLPCNDIQKIYQSPDGYIWLASKNGFYRYDGYSFKTYKSNLYHPTLLSNNNILCLEEDIENRLWIGTDKGLNVLLRKTGEIKQIKRIEFINNSISALRSTRNGKLFIGTDQGLFCYDYNTDSCTLYNRQNTNGIFPETPVKSLLEDSHGHLWIGTWNQGLFRYDLAKNRFYAYPRMLPKSAHVIFEDSKKRIWIGTWGSGLYVLENAYDPDNVRWKSFSHENSNAKSLPHDIIYSISEDINSRNIWIGTNLGLSILNDESKGTFTNFYPSEKDETISDAEVTSLLCDKQGMMWIGMLRGGVNTVSTRKPFFKSYPMKGLKQEFKTQTVSCILIDKDNQTLWMVIGTSGLIKYNLHNHTWQKIPKEKYFPSESRIPSIIKMTRLSNGAIWFGTYNDGIFEYQETTAGVHHTKKFSSATTPWLSGNRIYAIFEDTEKNKWIGTDYGLTMLAGNGKYLRFDTLDCNGNKLRTSVIMDIKKDHRGVIWAASSNNGIYKIEGKGKDISKYKISNYSINNKKLNSTNVACIHIDTKGRIWSGGQDGGLSLYDPLKNLFIPIHHIWNLPGDVIFNIQEDQHNNLWICTNSGLVKLTIGKDLQSFSYRLYTTMDGLLDNSFTRNGSSVSANGEIYLGSYQGLNSFRPNELQDKQSFQPTVTITDIKIHNCPWDELPVKNKEKISAFSPEFTKKIVLNYTQNNFNIEFAALGYENPMQQTYAYKLHGIDDKWQYSNSMHRFAYYNNLPPGTYTFELKATNSNGVWNSREATLDITILPPPWKTWWAYLLYTLFVIITIYWVYRTVCNRMNLQNELQLRDIEKTKSEELNHAKLQFFTNITHELLTPLTIISAAIDELRIASPDHQKQYSVMMNNINRLIRLLQQILEFRKVESGNLKLRVSYNDLASFVTNHVESFRPLIQKKQMHLQVTCPSLLMGWFDPDKVDKILYNLLSNAAKYNKTGGNIAVILTQDPTKKYAIITVSDDGEGISKEAQKDLFKRFYEGDYRKFKTTGTGIGLSLTKDLVLLHGGTITVNSDKGKGTHFQICLPITKESFKEDEIDMTSPESHDIQLLNIEDDSAEAPTQIQEYTLLIVEDNEDLLNLMANLLRIKYHIFTATNGMEALNIIRTEDIDLIISDVMMPVMDGMTLCKEIKSKFETSHIPILLLTAKTSETDRTQAYEIGADSYLTKPFNLTVLHARIHNLLRARERKNQDFKKQIVFEAKELNYTSIDEEFLQKAIDCVHQHLDEPEYDLAHFLQDMGTSRSTLFRKMKSLTGLSYVSFIRNVRLKAACQIMEEKKNVRISELAYAVGFNDPRYFSTCFKKEFGMQPREWFEHFVQHEQRATDEDIHTSACKK